MMIFVIKETNLMFDEMFVEVIFFAMMNDFVEVSQTWMNLTSCDITMP